MPRTTQRKNTSTWHSKENKAVASIRLSYTTLRSYVCFWQMHCAHLWVHPSAFALTSSVIMSGIWVSIGPLLTYERKTIALLKRCLLTSRRTDLLLPSPNPSAAAFYKPLITNWFLFFLFTCDNTTLHFYPHCYSYCEGVEGPQQTHPSAFSACRIRTVLFLTNNFTQRCFFVFLCALSSRFAPACYATTFKTFI